MTKMVLSKDSSLFLNSLINFISLLRVVFEISAPYWRGELILKVFVCLLRRQIEHRIRSFLCTPRHDEQKKIPVIEDAAEAYGSQYKGQCWLRSTQLISFMTSLQKHNFGHQMNYFYSNDSRFYECKPLDSHSRL